MVNGQPIRQAPMRKTPTEQVLEMQNQGKSDAEIVATLTNIGLKPAQISEAINQAKIKQAVVAKPAEAAPRADIPITPEAPPEGLAPSIMTPTALIPAPAPIEEVPVPGRVAEGEMALPEEYSAYAPVGIDTETVEEIAEEIISEKWNEAKTKISGMIEWKDYTNNRLVSIESKMKRVESSLDNLQAALLGKVQKYGQNIKDLGAEMKSLQGAFSKVLSPLATNVKELQRLTGELKTATPTKEKKAKEKKA